MQNETTLWKPVVGYEGIYNVSSCGQIRRVGAATGATVGRLKRQSEHPQGYLTVTLYHNNTGQPFLVHRIVAAAFLGSLVGREVNHKDGNKKNNHVSNLEIVLRQQNIDHAVNSGLINNKGENNSQAKITADTVLQIRSLYTFGGKRNGGMGYKALAKRFNLDPSHIRDIVKNKIWRHV